VIVMTLLACSCHKSASVEAPAPSPAPAPEPEPVDELTAVVRALSARDAAPACDEVEALVSDPVATLSEVVQTVEMPPYAPMRAATCLVDGHAEEVADLLVGWVTAEAQRGLGLLVVQRLDDLPLGVAVRIAERGRGGPVDPELTEALRASERPELQELAAP
jgi:hypothetical protein